MHRRNFLKLSSATASLLFFNAALFAETHNKGRILILLELKGGNDGLNTIIPRGSEYALYRRMRPSLAIDHNDIVPLNDELGLHHALSPLLPLWHAKEMAVALGVGYPDPNRSHFKSIAIYNSASTGRHNTNNGWINALFKPFSTDKQLFARGVAMGNMEPGPLAGTNVQAITMNDPVRFLKQAGQIEKIEQKSTHPMLSFIIDTENEIVSSFNILNDRLQYQRTKPSDFPKTKIGKDFQHAAQMIEAGIKTPVYKVTQNGYDTHTNQQNRHQRLLGECSDAILTFEKKMKAIGRWNDVVVMTYSEFGRRVEENGAKGTDHGTAAPHFLFGGSVQGGFYGTQPSLSKLDENGDLIYTTDFRSLYHSVANFCFGKSSQALRDYFPLPVFT